MLNLLFLALALIVAAMGFWSSQDTSLVHPMQFVMGAFLAVSGLRELEAEKKSAAYILFGLSGMCIVLGFYMFTN